MEDTQIINLYWERSETALTETEKKYNHYCYSIAYNILGSNEDAQECINETLMKAWNSIPPHRPNNLAAFLGKIARNTALDQYEKMVAKKRGNKNIILALDELQGCIPSSDNTKNIADNLTLTNALNRFLMEETSEHRKIFLQRYWYLRSIKEIAKEFAISESKTKMILLRARNKLKIFLEKEGVEI